MATLKTLIHINLAPYGLHPGQPTASKDGRLYVVPCQDTHNVLVIDSQRLDLVANIAVRPDASPSCAEVAHDNRTCAVALSEWTRQGSPQRDSTIAVIDLVDRRLVSEYRVGPGPNGLLFWERDGRRLLFVANTRGGSVSVLDINANWTETARIAVGKAPFSISELVERGEIAVTNFEDASVSIIDVASLAVRATFVLGNPTLTQPNAEWGAGDTTWVEQITATSAIAANWRSNELVEFDLTSGNVIRRSASPIDQPFFVRRLPQTQTFILGGSPQRQFATISATSLQTTDTLNLFAEGFPLGDLLLRHSIMNDPDDHSLVVFAPQGLGGLLAGPPIMAGPI